MEFKKILKILGQEKSLILGITILVVLLSLVFNIFQPTRYQVFLEVETKRINRPATPDYQYDEYYAIEAANLITETINSWFQSKNFSQRIFRLAGFDEDQLPKPQRFWGTKKLSAQNLEIKIRADNKNTAEELAKIIQKEIETKVSQLNLDQEGRPTFQTDIEIGPSEVVKTNLLNLILASLAGGVFLGIFLSLALYYLKTERNK